MFYDNSGDSGNGHISDIKRFPVNGRLYENSSCTGQAGFSDKSGCFWDNGGFTRMKIVFPKIPTLESQCITLR